MLQVDPGREFMGSVTKGIKNHKTYIRRGRAEIHRDQAIVERFNCTLAEYDRAEKRLRLSLIRAGKPGNI